MKIKTIFGFMAIGALLVTACNDEAYSPIENGVYLSEVSSNKTFSQQMRDNYSTSLGFTLSIPIFDAFSTRNAVRRAKVQAISAKFNLQDTETQLQKDIQQAYYRAVAAREKYDAGLKTEDAAQQAFVAMKEKYELGRSTPTEFEQAKTTYLKSTIDRLQSHYEYIMRCRILDFYYHNK